MSEAVWIDPLEGLRAEADARDARASSLLTAPAGASLAGRRVLVGVPYDGGIPSRPGARYGPGALREALARHTTHGGAREAPAVVDLGDLGLSPVHGGDAHQRIRDAAARVFGAGARPVFVGGDHGCTGSIVQGLARARPGLRLAVISVDAHLDVREYEDEAHLTSGTPFRRVLETGIAAGPRTAIIGVRAFANSGYYLRWAGERGIHLYRVEDVAERGAATVAREALDAAGGDADALYLSVDLDAADVSVAPGVSAPGIGGLSAREMIDLVRTVAADPRLVGADVMELSPPNDPDARTAKLAARLLLEMLTANGGGGGS